MLVRRTVTKRAPPVPPAEEAPAAEVEAAVPAVDAAVPAVALDALLQQSTHALVVLDAEANILRASLGLQLVVGVSVARLRGQSYLSLLHPGDAAEASVALRELALRADTKLGPLVFNWRLARADSVFVKAEHTFSRAVNEAGVLLFGVLQRALDDDPAYRELLESEARFRGLLALSSDWYWEQDEEFRFTMFAGQRRDALPSGASTLVGLRRWETPGEPIGISWQEHIAQLEAHQPFRDLILHRTAMFADKPIIIRVHGDPVFDASGKFIGYRGTASDITKEKQAQLAVAEAEARYRALLDIAADGIVVLDSSTIEFVNDTFVRMMHAQTPRQFLGRNILEFIHPDYVESVRARSERLVRGESQTDPLVERKLLRLDGSVLLAEMRGTAFTSGGRKLIQSVVRDISRYRHIQDELRRSEERFRDMAQAAGEYLWEIDADRRYTYLSDRVVEVLGYTKEELLGRKPTEFMPPEERDMVASWFDKHATESGLGKLEHRSITKSGATIWQQVSGVATHDAQGELIGYRGTGLNVTEQKYTEQQIRQLATHDALTGLPNRALLYDRLQQALAKAERVGSQVGVLFIDLDKFKRINDLLGHASGDELLRQAAKRLREALRSQDTLCRISGDEFVALLEGVDLRAELERAGARIVAALSEEFQLTSGRFSVGASVGVSVFPSDARSAEDLIRRADAAMYQAKNKGGGQTAIYSAELGPGTDERFRFEIELRRAITKDEFRAYLQPIFAARDGELTGAEALIRWQHPERGLLLPGRFIGAAESANLITTLGDWMINQVATQLRQWGEQGLRQVPVSVNVSIQQLATGLDFVEYLEDVLKRFQIPAHLLVLEVTESLLVQSIDTVSATLRAARALGLRVAMDDFGTGYSSLHLLRHLPIDTIKVDRAFVSHLKQEDKNFAVLSAIMGLARALELKVVAEGVEEQEQVELLRQLGFDLLQGYLFAKPMPVPEFVQRYLAPTSAPGE